ncbi:MAG TPA: hypothetical protein VKU85_07780 [bacterium]|nr:hypothetical protein [bacterium]
MDQTYEVYARRGQDEALTHLGAVELSGGLDVAAAVKERYGDDWLELVAIPGEKIAWAIGKE